MTSTKSGEEGQALLQELKRLHIPRTYTSFSSSQARYAELYVFSDASVKAIAAVGYLKLTDLEGLSEVGFILCNFYLTFI